MTAEQVKQGSLILEKIEELKKIKGAIQGNNWETVYQTLLYMGQKDTAKIKNLFINDLDSEIIDYEEKLNEL